jgi:hypothetical protein
LLAVVSQSVACSQHHTVSQRFARWLLTCGQDHPWTRIPATTAASNAIHPTHGR